MNYGIAHAKKICSPVLGAGRQQDEIRYYIRSNLQLVWMALLHHLDFCSWNAHPDEQSLNQFFQRMLPRHQRIYHEFLCPLKMKFTNNQSCQRIQEERMLKIVRYLPGIYYRPEDLSAFTMDGPAAGACLPIGCWGYRLDSIKVMPAND